MSAVAAENESSPSLAVPRPDTTPPPPPAIDTTLTSEMWRIRILTLIFNLLQLGWTVDLLILFFKIYLEIIFALNF